MRPNRMAPTEDRNTNLPNIDAGAVTFSTRGSRTGFSRQVALRLAALTTALVTFGVVAPLPAAQAETRSTQQLQGESGWKCAVAIPAAKAAAAAAELTLKSARSTVPAAERRLAAARADLRQARAAAEAAKKAATASPDNLALRDAAKTAAQVATAKAAAVATAAKSLKLAKAALPKATDAVKKANAKLDDLNRACE